MIADRLKDAFEFMVELGVVLITLVLMPLAAIFECEE
jgi:hypothetical protein